MKRLWIGLALLTAVVAGGFWVAQVMENALVPGAALLEDAANLAQEGQWEQAEKQAQKAYRLWQEKRPMTTAFAEHEPIEQIDEEYLRLEVYARMGDQVQFVTTCRTLAEKMERMGQYHNFSLTELL